MKGEGGWAGCRGRVAGREGRGGNCVSWSGICNVDYLSLVFLSG